MAMKLRVTLLSLMVCLVTAGPSFLNVDDIAGISEFDGCSQKPVDLFFLLDSSSSIWAPDFKKQLKFVNRIVDNFDISPHTTRVGVASFSYNYDGNVALTDASTKDVLQDKISNIRQLLGGTNTHDALESLREQGLDEATKRPGVSQIVFVLTDGESIDTHKTARAAKLLKESGVTVYAIGVGGNTNKQELEAIASEPSERYMFSVGNYGLLETIITNLTEYACQDVNDAPSQITSCGHTNPADVMFLVDPFRLGYIDTQTVYTFIGNLTKKFDMASGNIRVGMESQLCPYGNITLKGYGSQDHAVRSFAVQKYKGLRHMLKRLRTHSFKPKYGGRDAARHMSVIFIDDKLHNAKEILDEARRSKNSDVEIFVVAIGENVNEKELKTLCSSSVERHYIKVKSYEELYSMENEFLEKFCHGL